MPAAENRQRVQVERVRSEFAVAEAHLKRVERLEQKLLIPSINELRYAAKHLLDALTTADADHQVEHFDKAVRHCQRASYDAVEVVLMFHLEQLKRFQDDYRTIVIDLKIIDYPSLRLCAQRVQDFINEHKPDETRQEQRDRAVALCDELVRLMEPLPIAREELNKVLLREQERAAAEAAERAAQVEEQARVAEEKRAALQRENDKLKLEAQRANRTITVAVLALVATISGVVVNYFNGKRSSTVAQALTPARAAAVRPDAGVRAGVP